MMDNNYFIGGDVMILFGISFIVFVAVMILVLKFFKSKPVDCSKIAIKNKAAKGGTSTKSFFLKNCKCGKTPSDNTTYCKASHSGSTQEFAMCCCKTSCNPTNDATKDAECQKSCEAQIQG